MRVRERREGRMRVRGRREGGIEGEREEGG